MASLARRKSRCLVPYIPLVSLRTFLCLRREVFPPFTLVTVHTPATPGRRCIMRTRWMHPTIEIILRFHGFSAPGVGVGPILTEVGGHSTNAFRDPLAFDRDHLSKQAFGAFMRPAPQVAFTGFCAYELSGAS